MTFDPGGRIGADGGRRLDTRRGHGLPGGRGSAPATNYLTLRSGIAWGRYDVSVFIDNLTNARPELTRYSEVIGNPVHRDFTFRPLTGGITAAYRY
jgi:hypothetical protein